MNNIQHVDLPMRELMNHVTLEVTVSGQREHKIRAWCGTKLMALAAWVLGCHIEVDFRDN